MSTMSVSENFQSEDNSMFAALRYDVFERRSVEGTSKILLSRFYLPGTLEVLKTLPKDNFVVFVGYSNKKGGDAQIGITGSMKNFENRPTTAVWRELEEETGFTTTLRENLKLSHNVWEPTKNDANIKRSIFAFEINASLCEPLHKIPQSSKRDDSIDKVSLLIHGSFSKVSDLMKKVPIRNGEEDIDYFLIVPVVDAIEMATYLVTEQPENPVYWPIVNIEVESNKRTSNGDDHKQPKKKRKIEQSRRCEPIKTKRDSDRYVHQGKTTAYG